MDTECSVVVTTMYGDGKVHSSKRIFLEDKAKDLLYAESLIILQCDGAVKYFSSSGEVLSPITFKGIEIVSTRIACGTNRKYFALLTENNYFYVVNNEKGNVFVERIDTPSLVTDVLVRDFSNVCFIMNGKYCYLDGSGNFSITKYDCDVLTSRWIKEKQEYCFAFIRNEEITTVVENDNVLRSTEWKNEGLGLCQERVTSPVIMNMLGIKGLCYEDCISGDNIETSFFFEDHRDPCLSMDSLPRAFRLDHIGKVKGFSCSLVSKTPLLFDLAHF